MLGGKLKTAVIRPEEYSMIYMCRALTDTGPDVDLVDMGSSILPNLVDKRTGKIIDGQVISGEPVTSVAIQKQRLKI